MVMKCLSDISGRSERINAGKIPLEDEVLTVQGCGVPADSQFAEKLLKLLHERQTNGTKIAEVETPFQIPLFDRETGEVLPLPLRGVFDWVEDNDTLVEMKTSKRAYDTSSSSNRLQLAAYEFAYKEMFDESPNIRIVNLVKTKEPKLLETEVKLDDNDHKVLIGAAKLFILGVKDGIFHPIKSFMCKGCEYADICRNGV